MFLTYPGLSPEVKRSFLGIVPTNEYGRNFLYSSSAYESSKKPSDEHEFVVGFARETCCQLIKSCVEVWSIKKSRAKRYGWAFKKKSRMDNETISILCETKSQEKSRLRKDKLIIRYRSPGKHSLKSINYETATHIYVYNACTIQRGLFK